MTTEAILSSNRPPIPRAIKDQLLVSCKHSCCICGRFWVKIHHIDRNPSNNDESNLIPLCGYHHDMVGMNPPAGAGVQSITPSQLRLYKEDWIAKCKAISPIFLGNIEELKAKVVTLDGKVERLRQNERGIESD